MPRYFSYIRFSSKPQEEGDSEDRQLRHGQVRAAELKADFVDAYTDRAASGWTRKNHDGALVRMIEDVQSGDIKRGDIIGVENHDRLTRRPPLEAIELFIGFLNAGIVLDINGNLRTKEILNGPNGFGLLGISTNVHEWCADWHSADYYTRSPERNPAGPDEGIRRASRGGSWRHAYTICRVTLRSKLAPTFRYNDYGFRVAAEP